MPLIAANISMLFTEAPMLERFQAARAAGFDGVEMQFPYAESSDALARAARESAMPVVLINVPVSREHPAGIAARPEMRDSFRAQLGQIAEYAGALKVRFVHVLGGRINSPDERERCRDTYVENLLLAAAALEPLGVSVLIEPLNPHDVPNYVVGTLDDAQAVLGRCGPKVGLQFDLYHVARMGLDPAAEVERWLPRVRHVQFADVPGRHEPGTGSVPLESALAVLEARGYGGWLSAEYIPKGKTAQGLGWLAAWRMPKEYK
jgi:hydroxypyruvate isomerase